MICVHAVFIIYCLFYTYTAGNKRTTKHYTSYCAKVAFETNDSSIETVRTNKSWNVLRTFSASKKKKKFTTILVMAYFVCNTVHQPAAVNRVSVKPTDNSTLQLIRTALFMKYIQKIYDKKCRYCNVAGSVVEFS